MALVDLRPRLVAFGPEPDQVAGDAVARLLLLELDGTQTASQVGVEVAQPRRLHRRAARLEEANPALEVDVGAQDTGVELGRCPKTYRPCCPKPYQQKVLARANFGCWRAPTYP